MVDGVQHRRRRAIELAIVLLETRLRADFRVDDIRAQIVAGLAALDDGVRETIDALVVARRQIDGHSAEAPRAPQHRHVLLDDALRALGAREILRAHVRDFLARITEAAQPRIAGVDEEAVLIQARRAAPGCGGKAIGTALAATSEATLRFFVIDATKNRDSRNIVNLSLLNLLILIEISRWHAACNREQQISVGDR